MYNEQQIQAYLNRLHYNKEITLTREVLDELIYACLLYTSPSPRD